MALVPGARLAPQLEQPTIDASAWLAQPDAAGSELAVGGDGQLPGLLELLRQEHADRVVEREPGEQRVAPEQVERRPFFFERELERERRRDERAPASVVPPADESIEETALEAELDALAREDALGYEIREELGTDAVGERRFARQVCAAYPTPLEDAGLLAARDYPAAFLTEKVAGIEGLSTAAPDYALATNEVTVVGVARASTPRSTTSGLRRSMASARYSLQTRAISPWPRLPERPCILRRSPQRPR